MKKEERQLKKQAKREMRKKERRKKERKFLLDKAMFLAVAWLDRRI